MFGALHLEMAMWSTVGDLLDGSGWTTILTEAEVASSGIAQGLLKASHLTRTRYYYFSDIIIIIIIFTIIIIIREYTLTVLLGYLCKILSVISLQTCSPSYLTGPSQHEARSLPGFR